MRGMRRAYFARAAGKLAPARQAGALLSGALLSGALAAGLAAGLCSCAPRAALVIEPSSPALRREIGKLAAEYSGKNGIRITLSDSLALKKGETTVLIGWGFPSASAGSAVLPIPDELLRESGYGTARAFERWGREGEAWRELPILWDAWGFAFEPDGRAINPDKRAAPIKAARLDSGGTFSWKDRDAAVKAGPKVLVPGGESGARQSLFWFMGGAGADPAATVGMMLGDDLSRPSGRERFRALAVIAEDPLFSAGAGRMMKGDVDNLSKNSRIKRLFGDYQWLRQVPSRTPRDFSSLAYTTDKGYTIPASILAGRVVGSGAAADKARGFLAWLVSERCQRALSDGSGYMAANFNAPNLDPNGLKARAAAIGALSVVPIDPEPARGSAAEAWDSLLGRVLARPTEWEKTMAEGMGKR